MKRRDSVDRTQSLKENKGSALVMVLVVIAFISILVSVMYYRSILNYQMKMVDYKAKDNFYTAENAMDEIRTGLQSIVSNAIAESYAEVMQNYDDFTNEQRKLEFTKNFSNKVELALIDSTNSNSFVRYYNRTVLRNFITNLCPPGGTVGAVLVEEAATNELVLFEEAVVLRNVKLTYTDADGYVSIINTDIRIEVPNIDFNEAFKYPDILDFSIIANESLVVNNGLTSQIQGNMYAGADGIGIGTDASNAKLTISDADLVVTDGVISLGESDSLEFITATGEISDLWAKGIELNSSDVKINSAIHVADDTTINGKNSELIYSGAYYGFGEESGSSGNGSEGSSAILINGLGSKLDFSGLSALTLAGNAYISISGKGSMTDDVETGMDGQADRTKIEGSYAFTEKENVIMGESIAVKSNQLAYLVPAECIGYYGEKCILGSNPVTQARLNDEFITKWSTAPVEEKALYQEVNMEKLCSMNNLLISDVSIRKLFKRENASTTLVYYYMVFKDSKTANSFFEKYYTDNKTKMDTYISKYVADIKFADYENMMVDLAGNIMRVENDGTNTSYILEKDTLAASNSTPDYKNALNHFKEQYASFADKYKFENVVDTNIYVQPDPGVTNSIYLGGMYEGTSDVKYVRFGDGLDEVNAVVVKVFDSTKAYELTNLIPDIDKLRVVVVDGDVVVKTDYKGIIIASGKVTIEDGMSVIKDEEGVAKAMQLSKTNGTEEYNFIDVFKDGNALETPSGGPGTGNEEYVKIEELVGYTNWSKQ